MRFYLRIWTPALAALLLALVARYAFIQPAPIGALCASAMTPWWCGLRQALIMTFATQGLGFAALILGVLAVFSRSRRVSLLGVCVGLFGLVLYCYEMSAVGLTLSVLTLARVAQLPKPAVGP
ncbi:MAG TPA: hypothetical protein VJU83_01385 [Burkholderiales bacterium]|nr:hypothetical protein [Burkholderiales bacterium]